MTKKTGYSSGACKSFKCVW